MATTTLKTIVIRCFFSNLEASPYFCLLKSYTGIVPLSYAHGAHVFFFGAQLAMARGELQLIPYQYPHRIAMVHFRSKIYQSITFGEKY